MTPIEEQGLEKQMEEAVKDWATGYLLSDPGRGKLDGAAEAWNAIKPIMKKLIEAREKARNPFTEQQLRDMVEKEADSRYLDPEKKTIFIRGANFILSKLFPVTDKTE